MTNFGVKSIRMHELSIVQNILEIASQEVRKARATKVDQINLEIGTLSGVEMEALLFAWKACITDTVLAGTKRKIIRIEAIAQCTACEYEFPTEDFFAQCPACGNYMTELIKGKELKIKSLVVS